LEVASKEDGLSIDLAGILPIGERHYEVPDFIILYGDLNVPKVDYKPTSSRQNMAKQRPWILELNRVMNGTENYRSGDQNDQYYGANLFYSKGVDTAAVDHIVTLGSTRIDAYANLRVISEHYNSRRQ